MSDKHKFEEILDSCLSRLLKSETLEECLGDYPEQADSLRPLLETAISARQALAYEARPEFKKETRRKLLTTLAEMKEKKTVPKVSWFAVFKARWVVVSVSLALAILMSGGGLMAASGHSLPGDFLYSFKLASEQVLLTFSFGDEAKAKTYAHLAERRVDEIIRLAGKQDVANIEEATERLDSYLVSITDIFSPQATFDADNAAGDGAILPTLPESDQRDDGQVTLSTKYTASDFELLLQQYGLEQVAALQNALDVAPQGSREALEHSLAVTLAGYQNILDVIE